MNHYLGVDVGGSNIKIVLVSPEGKRKDGSVIIKTPKNKKRFLRVLSSAVRAFVSSGAIIGIGIGLPGIVDPKKGTLINAPNMLFLNGWNAKNFFKKFKVPIKIDNDSRCFLRAEAMYGAGRGFKHIAVLTVGTGVGGGLLIDGKMYYGSRSGAGEFGHMVVNQKKTLEQLAGKKAFIKGVDRNEVVGIGVSNIVNAFDPQVIILGGGGILGKNLKIPAIRSIARKYIMSPFGKKTKIIKGMIGEYAGALGAALLFFKSRK